VWGLARKRTSTALRTRGMRVDPPTITTSSICSGRDAGVFHASCDNGPSVRSMRSLIRFSKSSTGDFAMVVFAAPTRTQSARPGRNERDSFARMTSRRRVWTASPMCERSSAPFRLQIFELRCAADGCRCHRRRDACRPLVARTSKMPSCSLRIEMSKVPPPRS